VLSVDNGFKSQVKLRLPKIDVAKHLGLPKGDPSITASVGSNPSANVAFHCFS